MELVFPCSCDLATCEGDATHVGMIDAKDRKSTLARSSANDV